MAVNGIEIKVGQKWKRRDGSTCVIRAKQNNGTYPWIDDNGVTYTDAGFFSARGRGVGDLVELIAYEHPLDDAPAPVPQAVGVAADKVFPDISEHDRAAGKVKLSDCYLPKEKQVCAPDLLDAAAGHMRNRAATYDKPEGERSIAQVVTAFNAIHGTDMTEVQGWHFMSLLKQVRAFSSGKAHRDSLEDNIAYSALMAEAMLKGGAK